MPSKDQIFSDCSDSGTRQRNVEGAPADTEELAEHAALQQCLETLNGIRVDIAIYIPILMLNDGMR